MAIKNVQGLKSIRQINRLIAGYKEYGKEFFIHGNRGRKILSISSCVNICAGSFPILSILGAWTCSAGLVLI